MHIRINIGIHISPKIFTRIGFLTTGKSYRLIKGRETHVFMLANSFCTFKFKYPHSINFFLAWQKLTTIIKRRNVPSGCDRTKNHLGGGGGGVW